MSSVIPLVPSSRATGRHACFASARQKLWSKNSAASKLPEPAHSRKSNRVPATSAISPEGSNRQSRQIAISSDGEPVASIGLRPVEVPVAMVHKVHQRRRVCSRRIQQSQGIALQPIAGFDTPIAGKSALAIGKDKRQAEAKPRLLLRRSKLWLGCRSLPECNTCKSLILRSK